MIRISNVGNFIHISNLSDRTILSIEQETNIVNKDLPILNAGNFKAILSTSGVTFRKNADTKCSGSNLRNFVKL